MWTARELLTLYLLVSIYGVDLIVAGAVFLAGLAADALAALPVGVAGLALAGGPGRAPTFAPGVFPIFVGAVVVACVVAALLAWPRLTLAGARAFSAR